MWHENNEFDAITIRPAMNGYIIDEKKRKLSDKINPYVVYDFDSLVHLLAQLVGHKPEPKINKSE